MKDKIIFIFMILIIIAFIGSIIFDIVLDYAFEETNVIVIKDKYVKTEGNAGIYFIIDKDNNAYVIRDLLFKKKFNSTDIYNQIEIGKTYKVKTTGKRIHFLSKYKNINEIERSSK